MSLTLSSSDRAALAPTARLLASPLDHSSTDDWRRAVNRQLKSLLHADSIGFLLPTEDADLAFTEEHDLKAINQYADWVPPTAPSGAGLFERIVEMGVSRIEDAYEGDLGRYLRSTYYNEYSGSNRACDTLSVARALPGAEPLDFACVQMWHERWEGRVFGIREVVLLQLLYPAFVAGVESYRRWHRHRDSLLTVLDTLGEAVQVCNATGTRLHRTPALIEMLECEPDAAPVENVLRTAVESLAFQFRGGVRCHDLPDPGRLAGTVQTSIARYAYRACLYGAAPRGSAPLIVTALERLTPVPQSAEDLRQAYGLTRAESRVAGLLATGKANAEIATDLVISPHTARRHTERVLAKLRVRARAEVAAKILR